MRSPFRPSTRRVSSARDRASPWPISPTSPSRARQMAWKVPIVMRGGGPPPQALLQPLAHLSGCLVGEGHRSDLPGRTPRSSTSHAIRSTRVLVLPVPGPATTATVRSSAEMAACCWGLERWRPCSPPAPPPSAALGAVPAFSPPVLGSPLPQTGRPVRSGAGSPPGQGGRWHRIPPSNPGRRSTCPPAAGAGCPPPRRGPLPAAGPLWGRPAG